MDVDPASQRLSRRKLLKRAGAGAAIVWSAPAITSISSAGAAAGTPISVQLTCCQCIDANSNDIACKTYAVCADFTCRQYCVNNVATAENGLCRAGTCTGGVCV
jgi:hypothetical protein